MTLHNDIATIKAEEKRKRKRQALDEYLRKTKPLRNELKRTLEEIDAEDDDD